MIMTYDEMIAVLNAAKEGKKLQRREKLSDKWEDLNSPALDFNKYEYRVKPNDYRPYNNAKEFLEAQREHGMYVIRLTSQLYYMPTCVGDMNVELGRGIVEYQDLLRAYFWQDKHPCGVLDE